ncbi:Protein kinase-like domain containing protein [Trema orientale]|uniref:Protein kinase-like domain containing protein n=1 Tax=Trema orientale TaxID=63057 RepID=A0A2P5ECR4_TREOI|nr:Protein kinase-like domain containing protein [Trema orientale]
MVGLCLDQDPSKRPTAEKLLKHPFFKSCNKGPDFLVKNVLQGLASVEERFRFAKTLQSLQPVVNDKNDGTDEDEEDDEEGVVVSGRREKQRRISGWNFNEDGFKLDPVFPTESSTEDDSVVKQVRFGGETIIKSNINIPSVLVQAEKVSTLHEDSTVGELTESNASSPADQVGSSSSSSDQQGMAGGGEMGESSPSSPGLVVGSSTSSEQGLDKERVLHDIVLIRRSVEEERRILMEALRVLGAEEAVDVATTREEYLAQTIEKLRSELEIERKKNLELEMEVEFLKLQISSRTSD